MLSALKESGETLRGPKEWFDFSRICPQRREEVLGNAQDEEGAAIQTEIAAHC